MKDNIRFTFERNDYYTGKLLSAKDFKTEQEYFNDKRRLFNIFTIGSGILYGLDVIKTGDKRQEESISIKPGVAIDSLGRELVVPEIDNVILSELQGFPEDEYIGALYLCLEYDEKGKAEASIDDEDEDSTLKKYNRIIEGYKVVLKLKPPELLTGITRLAYNFIPIYEDEKLFLWHKSPKYMNEGSPVECSFILVKRQRNIRVQVLYEVTAKGINTSNERIIFESPDKSEETEFEHKYLLEGANDNGQIILNSSNVKLTIGDVTAEIDGAEITIESEKIPFKQKVVKEYYNENLKERMEIIQRESVCLAKIFITQVRSAFGTRYHIDHVQDSIFSCYIYPQYVQSWLICEEEAYTKENKNSQPVEQKDNNDGAEQSIPSNSTTGVIEVPVEEINKGTYYSEEIEHGFGIGAVDIKTAFEVCEEDAEARIEDMDEAVISGDLEIFSGSSYRKYSGLKTGVILYPKKGTFQIGINAKNYDLNEKWLTVRWWAYKCEE